MRCMRGPVTDRISRRTERGGGIVVDHEFE
jgi:hypothetical protein